MSDFVRPHRRQPTRLPRPWDSPGKNTGVGCHFLLQCVKVKSEREVARSRPILSDPMDCGPPGSSVHGIFQARVLEWSGVPLPSPADLHIHMQIHKTLKGEHQQPFDKLYSEAFFYFEIFFPLDKQVFFIKKKKKKQQKCECFQLETYIQD